MFYAIIIIVTAVALFLIFRNDHDDSYSKSEKAPGKDTGGRRKSKQQETQYQKETHSADSINEPKAGKKASSLKEQILGEIEQALSEAKKGAEEPMKMLGEAMDMAKKAMHSAMNEARKEWNPSGMNPDVDEQFQDDEEELDLSFLDNIDYSDNLEENTETFDITGLKYHCNVYDLGRIVGIVKPDPSNVHDSRAQAVIRSDGKLLGYIPRTQLDWYEDFNQVNVTCPFVGELEMDGSGQLSAEIKVIIPSSRAYVEEEIIIGLS